MKFKSFLVASLVAITLSGCQTTSEQQDAKSVANVPLGVPLAPNYRNEIEIARYTEVLQSSEMSTEQQAE
jgi:lipoprotein NlpI